MPEITAAVVVKDRRERMLACLDALLVQDHPDFEILVIDNGSADGTADACRERARTASVPVRVESVTGTLGRARNAAAAGARGEFVAFVDSDCHAAPSWLSHGAAVLRAAGDVGVACGVTLPAEPLRAPWPKTMEVRELTWRFETCNAFYRTAALRASEGFDEVVGDGWEDTAAGYAVLRDGWRAAFAPEAVVEHDVTYPGFWFHVRREQRATAAARIARRYPEVRRHLLFAGLFFDWRAAAWLAAAAGLGAGRRMPPALVLTLPYAAFLARRREPLLMVQWAIYHGAIHTAMLRGAVRHRCLVL